MTTYNTRNPLGSSEPKDLYDNAENLDVAVNSEQPYWTDRFGKIRSTLHSIEGVEPQARAYRDEAAASATAATNAKNAAQGFLGTATETASGITRLATDSEVLAGQANDKVVTPKKLRLGFKYMPGQNGYIGFPTWMSGLIIQWGTVGGFDSYTINFPMAFPNEVFGNPIVTCSGTGVYASANASFAESGEVTKSNFKAFVYRPGINGGTQSNARAISWLAIGR